VRIPTYNLLIAAKGVKALDKAYAKRSVMALPVATNAHFISSSEDGLVKVTNISSEYIGNHLTAIALPTFLVRSSQ
jgi:putative DNA primase/helicase